MAVILVTGGAGFIGSHIVQALLERGEPVRVLDDLSTGSPRNLDHPTFAPELHLGSITDPVAVERAMRGVRAVLHLAACPSVVRSQEEPLVVHEVNATGTLRVLEAASQAGVRRFVFAGSSAVYGIPGDEPSRESDPLHPLSPYGAQKLLGEHYCRYYAQVRGLHTVVLRYFNVFGPRQDPSSPYSGVISLFSDRVQRGVEPQVDGDGLQTRDFTYVENVVAGNLLALESDVPPGSVFNLATGCSVSLLEVIAELNRALGTDLQPRFGPPRTGDIVHSCADIGAARTQLGYRPEVDFADGLGRTLEWMRSQQECEGSEERRR